MSIFKKIKLVTISSWAIVLLWLVFIFFLSAQPAAQSKGFSEKVTEIIIKTAAWVIHADIDAKTLNGLVMQFHHLVRKLAHGWIYFILAVLIIKAFIKNGIRTGYRAYVAAIVFSISYAVLDEIHQTFVSGRGGQISDILIDTAGAVLGIGAYLVYDYICYLYNSD